MNEGFVYVNKYSKNMIFSEEEHMEAKKILNALEKFSTKMIRKFADAAVQSVEKNQKWFYLGQFDKDDLFENVNVHYLLGNKWRSTLSKYYSANKCKTVKERIEKCIKTPKYNNGIDPITNQPYYVSIFYYKSATSKFKNGVMISRDGIEYK